MRLRRITCEENAHILVRVHLSLCAKSPYLIIIDGNKIASRSIIYYGCLHLVIRHVGSRLHFRDNTYRRLRVETISIKRFPPLRRIDTARWRARLKNTMINNSRCSISLGFFPYRRILFLPYIASISSRTRVHYLFRQKYVRESIVQTPNARLFLKLWLIEDRTITAPPTYYLIADLHRRSILLKYRRMLSKITYIRVCITEGIHLVH